MSEETQQMIERLADKLGTSAEQLWWALLRQAPITSTIESIMLLIYAAVLVWGYRLVREKTKPRGDWNDGCGGHICVWFVWCFAATIFALFVFDRATGILAGFFNPEYWAIKEILGK